MELDSFASEATTFDSKRLFKLDSFAKEAPFTVSHFLDKRYFCPGTKQTKGQQNHIHFSLAVETLIDSISQHHNLPHLMCELGITLLRKSYLFPQNGHFLLTLGLGVPRAALALGGRGVKSKGTS